MRGVLAARLTRLSFALPACLVSLACATTTWVPKPDDPNSDEIAASLAGKRAILLVTAPAMTDEAPAPSSTRMRPRTVELDIERADAFAIHGETASGVPRSVTVSDVRSISYATDRAGTAVLGAFAGACVLGVAGYVWFSKYSWSDSDLGGTGAAIGAVTGFLTGALLGALIGRPVTVRVESASGVPPPAH